jgi:hypothetical protein
MLRLLMSMHHIALCTPCIALVNGGHLLHMRVDHAELKLGFQMEQVQWAFRGPQASSCEEANIIVIKASFDAFNHATYLLSSILLYALL